MTTPIESLPSHRVCADQVADVVGGPWPTYTNGRHLPEQQRWHIYESAKATRLALEGRGVVMTESYDQFIKRVTGELDL